MPSTKSEIIAERNAVIAKARALCDASEERELTQTEREDLTAHLDRAKSLATQVKRLNGDTAVKGAIRDLSGAVTNDGPSWATKGKAGHTEWAKSTASHVIARNTTPDGRKAVTSGQLEVSSVLQPGVDRLPEYPTRLLDLLVNRKALGEGNVFSYYRQTVRDHRAAPVADNAEKPVSIYTLGEEEDRVRVIAHLSEPVPLRMLADISELEEFLTSEMEEGLKRAIEQQILSGDGEGENMTGLLETSGLTVQAWSSDLLTTLRKAATNLEVQGETPTAWLIHPSDVEVLDLLTDDNARHYFQGPSQQLGQSAPVWSLPIVRSVAIEPGTAILGDWERLQLVVREDSRLDVDTAGELFRKNQAQLRMEGRYGNAVLRPSAFCQVATAAAAG